MRAHQQDARRRGGALAHTPVPQCGAAFAGFKRSCQQIVAFAKPSPCLLVFCMLFHVMQCLHVRVRAWRPLSC